MSHDFGGLGPQVWMEKMHKENKSHEDRAAFCFFPGPLELPSPPLVKAVTIVNTSQVSLEKKRYKYGGTTGHKQTCPQDANCQQWTMTGLYDGTKKEPHFRAPDAELGVRTFSCKYRRYGRGQPMPLG